MTVVTPAAAPFEMSRPLTFAMAAATGAAVANIYYNQPMLVVIAQDLPQAATLISPVTQLGYAAGLFLLVPLGDMVERRRLIATQFLVLAAALALLAFASGTVMTVIASLLVGTASTVAQQIIPLSAHLSHPDRRGATVGTLMAGLLCGVLLSRTLAGFVAAHFGWREMYVIAIPIALAAAAGMYRMLPRSENNAGLSYPQLLGSLFALWKELPDLRRAAVTQALLFAGFSGFWTALPFRLAEPQYGFGSEVAGLFGLVGLVGVVAAPISGRIADRRGPAVVVRYGALIVLVSWLLFAVSPTLTALVIGVVLLDFGLQSVMVSNQHVIYSLRPDARARLNTVFMGSMFLGGAAGSAISIYAWHIAGWPAVSAFAIVVSLLAFLAQLLARKTA